VTTISLENDSKFLSPWTFNLGRLTNLLFRGRFWDFVKLMVRSSSWSQSLVELINSNLSFLLFCRARFKINPSFSRLFLVEPGVFGWKECFEEKEKSSRVNSFRRILELLNTEEGVILNEPNFEEGKSRWWYLSFSSEFLISN